MRRAEVHPGDGVLTGAQWSLRGGRPPVEAPASAAVSSTKPCAMSASTRLSHRLREVFDLSQRITVLKDGRRVTTLRTKDTDADDVVRAMVGRELTAYYPPRTRPEEIGPERLTVTGGSNARIGGIDLTLRAGEVVGVAGLQGSGRTSLARALFGAAPFTAGTMTVGGRQLRPARPREAIRAGIALVTEVRRSTTERCAPSVSALGAQRASPLWRPGQRVPTAARTARRASAQSSCSRLSSSRCSSPADRPPDAACPPPTGGASRIVRWTAVS